jgi:uncharacterized protein (DUF302 family)
LVIIRPDVTLIINTSAASHEQTVQRLTEALEQRGIKLFARIDHAAAATEVGIELEPELVLVFGNPRGGTPLMQADAHVGIELPLKILVFERGGVVQLAYHDPHELAEEYQLDDLGPALEQMAGLMAQLVAEASAAP